jgi:hypothetical protein
MFSLPSEEEGLAFLFLPPPVSFTIWNVCEVQFQFRAESGEQISFSKPVL